MLFCLCLVALLLYDTVFASAVCSQTFDKAPGKIEAVSTHYHHLGRRKCVYLIRAPLDFSISLNFTDIFGFIPTATASTATTSAATDSSTTTTTTTTSSINNASLSITNNVASISSSPKERHNQHHHQQQQLQQQQHHSRYRHPHLASSEAEELTSQAVPTVTLINGPIRRGQCRLPQVEILEEDETSGDRVVMGKICRSSHGNQLLLLVSGQEKNKNVNSSDSSSNSASVTTMTTNSNVTSSFDSGTSSSAITTAQPQKVFHSLAHTLRLVYEWGLGPHHSGFSLEFNFQHKPTTPFEINKSGPCEFTCADSRCISSWSMVCDGSDDCADRSDEHDCPHHHRHLPPTEGRTKFSSNEVSSIQIIIIVLAVVLAVGVIAFMVSHYKMGARSWSDRWTRTSSQQVSQTGQQQHHHHHSHPSPQHHQYHHPHQQHHNNHLDHNTSTTTAYVQPHDDRLSHEVALFRERQIRLQSVQTDLELALPPSISLPDGEEYPYDSLQHLHLRNAEQESEILRECIRPPPNRTIFEGESPPPYRACSMGTLHSSSSSSSTFSLMSGSANNGALRVRSADYSAPLVMRCHSMCSNNCNCGGSGHHHSSSSGGSSSSSSNSSTSSSSSNSSSSSGSVAGGGRGTTPLSHHLRIARLVNSRPSNAASSTSLPASSSVTSTFSSSSCSFCDPPTAASSSPVNYNHNGHGNRCPNGAITTSTNRCCRLNVTKTEQRPGGTTGLSSSSSGGSNSGGSSGSSSHAMTTAAVSASSAGVGHTRVTDNLNGSRHHPVTLTLTEGSREAEEDRNRNCSSGNAGSGHGGGGNNATGGNAGV